MEVRMGIREQNELREAHALFVILVYLLCCVAVVGIVTLATALKATAGQSSLSAACADSLATASQARPM